MKRIVALILVALLIAVSLDSYQRAQRRKVLGPGVELRHGQVIEAEVIHSLVLSQLKVGDEFLLKPLPAESFGSTAIGDALLADAVLVARVVRSGKAQTLGHATVIFNFREIRFPSGKRFKFKGTIFNQDDPSHIRDSALLGSFVGMEYSGLGVLAFYVLGACVPYYYGLYTDPMNYLAGDVSQGVKTSIKVHYAEYIPFNFNKKEK